MSDTESDEPIDHVLGRDQGRAEEARAGGLSMLKTLALVVVGVGLYSGVRYLGRLLGWPDSVSIAVVTGMALLVVVVANRHRWK
jgi:hypothetical protein